MRNAGRNAVLSLNTRLCYVPEKFKAGGYEWDPLLSLPLSRLKRIQVG